MVVKLTTFLLINANFNQLNLAQSMYEGREFNFNFILLGEIIAIIEKWLQIFDINVLN